MKVKLELTPYQAASILAFLREFINEDSKDEPQLKAIHESVDAYEKEIGKRLTDEMIDDMMAENEMNILTGRSPKNKGGRPVY